MKWEDRPTWIRLGLIVGIIYFLITFAAYNLKFTHLPIIGIVYWFLSFPVIFFWFLLSTIGILCPSNAGWPECSQFGFFIASILMIIPGFIIGALIGWVHGKIKVKK